MKRGKSFRRVVGKSFAKNGKISFGFLSVCILCSLIISAFSGILSAVSETEMYNAKEKYGSYQFGYMDLTEEKLKNILGETKKYEQTVFTSEYIEIGDSGIYKMSVDDNYLKISDMKLTEGKAPEEIDEAACNRASLSLLGYKDYSLGQQIIIDGNIYTLTGIISSKSYEDCSIITPISSKDTEGKRFAIMIDTGRRNYGTLMDSLSQKYNIDSLNIFVNDLVISYSGIDRFNRYCGMMKVMYYICGIMVVPCCMLTVTVAVFYGRSVYAICEKYVSIGIEKKKLFVIFMLQILKSLLISAVGVTFLSAAALRAYFSISDIKADLCMLFINMGVLSAIYILASFIFSACLTAVKFFSDEKCNRGRKYKFKNREKKSALMTRNAGLYMMMSIRNMHLGKTKHFLLVMMLSATCAMFAETGYFLEQYTDVKNVRNDYDFAVEFKYKDFEGETHGYAVHEILYNEMVKQKDIFRTLPVYAVYDYVKVGKTSLNKKYLKYLSSMSSKYADDINGNSTKISIPVTVLGLDNDFAWKYGIEYDMDSLKENECILLKNTPAPNGRYGYCTGLNENSRLGYNFGANDDYSRSEDIAYTVKDTVEKYKSEYFDYYYNQIIAVNMKEFEKFTDKKYPDLIYIKALDREKTINYFEGMSGIEFKNLEYEQKRNEGREGIIKATGIILFAIMLAMLVLIIVVTIYIGYFSMKRQAAALYAIGIERYKIAWIFNGDILRLFENSLICSILISLAATYGVYAISKEELYFYQYLIPWKFVFMPIIITYIGLIAAAAVIYYVIGKMDAVAILNQE